MNLRVKIEVTQEDIDRGARRSCCNCPIALAVKRLVPHCSEVDVRCGAIYAKTPELWKADASISVIDFISGFDAGRPVQPFSFPLDLRSVKSYWELNPAADPANK